MTRREALREEAAALDALKLAACEWAVSVAHEECPGDPTWSKAMRPLETRGALSQAAKRYWRAAHAVVDAVLRETPEERATYEGARPAGGRTIPSVTRKVTT